VNHGAAPIRFAGALSTRLAARIAMPSGTPGARLLEFASRYPVHRTPHPEARIATRLRDRC